MDNDGIREFEGDWDAYKEFLAENTAPMEKETAQPKNSYVQAKERKAAINRVKGALNARKLM